MTRFFMGIDGGGRKTAGVLLSADGRLAASATLAPCTIVGRPSDAALKVLVEIAARLDDRGASGARIIGIGLNGVDFDSEVPMQRAAIAEALCVPPEKIVLVNDGVAALWGATQSPAAAIVQHGSGITSAYRSDYGRETPFDNLNSGRIFDIRNELLPVVARMLDGRIEPTPLKDRLLAHLLLREEEYCEAVFRRSIDWRLLMGTPALVFEAYEQSDAGAELLVERAVADYAQTAVAMLRKSGRQDAELAFGGGTIAPTGERFWRRLRETVAARAPRAKVIRPKLAPEIGAAIMAAFADGQDVRPLYAKLLQDNIAPSAPEPTET
jgi:N-acetylglucosamine kinase-like BadF-type ATPase